MPITFAGSSSTLQALANTSITPANALNILIENNAPDVRIQGARTIRALVAAGRARDIQQTRQDWIVRGNGADSGIYRTEDVTTVNNTDSTKKAYIEIGEYKIAHRIRVNRVALQEARNRGPQAIQDLFGEELFSGLRVIHRRMNTLLYTGNGTPATANMNGLLMGYDDAASFEGIAVSEMPEWAPVVLENGGTARRLTRDLMRDFDTLCSLEEVGYNFVVMNPETAKAYSKEYDNIAGTLNAQGRAGGENVVANAELGYFGKTFNGLSILEDPECPDDAIYAMDLNTVQLLFFLLDNNPTAPNVNPIVVNRTYGFPIHIAELTTPVSTVREIEMYVMPQLRISNRRGLLGITDIDPALSFA